MLTVCTYTTEGYPSCTSSFQIQETDAIYQYIYEKLKTLSQSRYIMGEQDEHDKSNHSTVASSSHNNTFSNLSSDGGVTLNSIDSLQSMYRSDYRKWKPKSLDYSLERKMSHISAGKTPYGTLGTVGTPSSTYRSDYSKTEIFSKDVPPRPSSQNLSKEARERVQHAMRMSFHNNPWTKMVAKLGEKESNLLPGQSEQIQSCTKETNLEDDQLVGSFSNEGKDIEKNEIPNNDDHEYPEESEMNIIAHENTEKIFSSCNSSLSSSSISIAPNTVSKAIQCSKEEELNEKSSPLNVSPSGILPADVLLQLKPHPEQKKLNSIFTERCSKSQKGKKIIKTGSENNVKVVPLQSKTYDQFEPLFSAKSNNRPCTSSNTTATTTTTTCRKLQVKFPTIQILTPTKLESPTRNSVSEEISTCRRKMPINQTIDGYPKIQSPVKINHIIFQPQIDYPKERKTNILIGNTKKQDSPNSRRSSSEIQNHCKQNSPYSSIHSLIKKENGSQSKPKKKLIHQVWS